MGFNITKTHLKHRFVLDLMEKQAELPSSSEIAKADTIELEVSRTRGHRGLTHHLHSEAPGGHHRMAMTFARLRLIVFLRCIGLDWMPLYLCLNF